MEKNNKNYENGYIITECQECGKEIKKEKVKLFPYKEIFRSGICEECKEKLLSVQD